MELKSMKLDKTQQAEEKRETIAAQAPEYPYGLCLTLSDEAISNLGMAALPAVGDTMLMTARVKVTNVSQYDQEGGDKESSVGLQITDMSLGADEAPKATTEKLYGA